MPMTGQGVLLSGRGSIPLPGQILSGPIRISVPPRADLVGEFDYQRFLAGRSVTWLGTFGDSTVTHPGDWVMRSSRLVFVPLRQAIIKRLHQVLPGPEASMMGAVLLGARNAEGRALSRPFADLGMAHLFAVSGLHVGILLAVVLLPLKTMGAPPWWRAGPIVLLMLYYMCLTGLPGSVVRAAGLGILAVLANPLGRRADPLHFLGLLFWAGTLWSPAQVSDAGVRLSYCAAGGLLACQPALSPGGLLYVPRWFGKITSGLGVSLVAQWFTLPQVAASFGRLSLVSPVANLLGVPVFGLAVWAVVVGLILDMGFPWIGEAVLAWAWLLIRSLSGAATCGAQMGSRFLIGLAVPQVLTLSLFAGTTFGLLWVIRTYGDGREQRRRLSILLALVCAGFMALVIPTCHVGSRSPRIWQFDVGQGDCCLVEFPDNWRCLIDTGGRFGKKSILERGVLSFLKRRRIDSLAGICLTHGHLDHTAGAHVLERALDIQTWYVGGRANLSVPATVDTLDIVRPETGGLIHCWKTWRLTWLFVPSQIHASDENDQSLVLGLWQNDDLVFVWSGDLETGGEAQFLAARPDVNHCQVWKAGHHGSNTSGSQAFLEALSPSWILVSCGVENRHRHPSHGPYVVGGDTIPTIRTDLSGTVEITFDSKGKADIKCLY